MIGSVTQVPTRTGTRRVLGWVYSVRKYNVMTTGIDSITGVVSHCNIVHLGRQLLTKTRFGLEPKARPFKTGIRVSWYKLLIIQLCHVGWTHGIRHATTPQIKERIWSW